MYSGDLWVIFVNVGTNVKSESYKDPILRKWSNIVQTSKHKQLCGNATNILNY